MPENAKLDLYKKHKEEYVTPKKPVLVDIGPAQYLAIAGKGDPSASSFKDKIGCLYAVAFTTKMAKKKAGHDYAVAKLEGLWWGNRKGVYLIDEPKEKWNWKVMIRVPDFVSDKDRLATIKTLQEKGKDAAVAEVHLETLTEGRCVQMLHVGPYLNETASLNVMREFVASQGLSFHGIHHEIYLGDPNRIAPEKLKTILRNPVC